ncbi:MAG: superoxide dismutase, partial [Bacteroidales bacterium]
MAFELQSLPYAFDALEPYIDAKTMEIHHDKHHGAYTSNLNAAVQGTDLEGKSIEQILKNISAHPVAVRNNGGGFYNHNFFWEIMTPGGAKQPEGDLQKAMDATFGSYQNFKEAFTKAALTRFGSGWAWLVKQGESLVISSTPNQDNPLMDLADVKGTP